MFRRCTRYITSGWPSTTSGTWPMTRNVVIFLSSWQQSGGKDVNSGNECRGRSKSIFATNNLVAVNTAERRNACKVDRKCEILHNHAFLDSHRSLCCSWKWYLPSLSPLLRGFSHHTTNTSTNKTVAPLRTIDSSEEKGLKNPFITFVVSLAYETA
jgi:hypothetical protein